MAKIPEVGEFEAAKYRGGVIDFQPNPIGRAISSVGQDMQQAFDIREREDDEVAINDLRRQINEVERRIVFDPESGAVSKRGKDAFDLVKNLPTQFDEEMNRIAPQANTPKRQRLFQDMVLGRREQLTAWASRRSEAEREKYMESQYLATVDDSATRAAQLALTDPSTVTSGMQAYDGMQYSKPGSYVTELGPEHEAMFQGWVKENKIPWTDDPKADYDMRGFFKGILEGDPDAKVGVGELDGKPHFSDKWKTPFHQSFSNGSQYASSDAPAWNDRNQLVLADGRVVFDERNPENTTAVDVELAHMARTTIGHLRRRGASEEEIGATVRANEQKAHTAAMNTLLGQDDLTGAEAYFNKYAKRMDDTQKLDYANKLRTYRTEKRALVLTDDIMSKAGPITLTDADAFTRLKGVVRWMESRNRDFAADGSLLKNPTSSARGSMQVIAGTAAAPGFGITPANLTGDPANDAAELNRVGEAYLGKMLERYKGDVVKAMAAYHDGPGAVDDAIKENGAQWQSFLTPAGQSYVQNGLALLDKAQGVTPEKLSNKDYDELARDAAGGDPYLLDKIRHELGTRVAAETNAIKRRGDDAMSEAFKQLNAGTPFMSLPKELVDIIPGNDLPRLREFARSLASGSDRKTDQKFWGEMVLSPQKLIDTPLEANMDKLSDSDYQQLTLMKARLQQDPGGNEWTDIQSRKDKVTGMFIDRGINYNDDDVKLFMYKLSQRVRKDASPEAYEKAAAELFIEEKTEGSWFGTNPIRRYEMTTRQRDFVNERLIVPPEARQQAIGEIDEANRQRRAMGRPDLPMDEQTIRNWYLSSIGP